MMDRTDRHYRYFMRKITHHTLLYTEMITTGAIIHGDRQRLLGFDPSEHPIALQVGGDNPRELSECAKIAEDWGYDEINLNVGCPSDRVQSGNFGACLMRTPQTVADGVAAMRDVTSIPVTVKHRIGVDELDRYEDMANFCRGGLAERLRSLFCARTKGLAQGSVPKSKIAMYPHSDMLRSID